MINIECLYPVTSPFAKLAIGNAFVFQGRLFVKSARGLAQPAHSSDVNEQHHSFEDFAEVELIESINVKPQLTKATGHGTR